MPTARPSILGALLGVAALTGCATATTPPTITQPLALGTGKAAIADVTITHASGVWMNDWNINLLRDKIEADLQQGGYRTQGATPAYHMTVTITRFEEGNAAARLALIGLGQIHIEGTVSLTDGAGKAVGEYKITKAFAAGGVVGGLTTTENVEDGFAKSVVAGLAPKP